MSGTGPAPATATHIADGVDLLPGRFVPGTQPDGNTVIFTAPEGLVVVDTGRHPAHTQAILDFAAAARKPVAAIVNTHWHLDHVGGNILLRKAWPKAPVVASGAIEGALTGFLANYRKQLEPMIADPSTDAAAKDAFRREIGLIDAGKTLAPSQVVTASGVRTIAGRRLDVRLEKDAVTAGDVWVLDPKTRVLVAGDLVTLPAPFFDTACPRVWQSALDRLAKEGFAVLVPGHGAPMTRAQFDAYRTAFASLVACGGSTQTKAACIDGWVKDAGSLIAAADETLARGLIDYYVEAHLRPGAKRPVACPEP